MSRDDHRVASPTVADVVAAVARLYPPHLAESWDSVGLVCGDPQRPVHTVVVAVDPTEEVVDQAIQFEADVLLVHHPLLFSAVNSVAAVDPKGRVITSLIGSGCALLTAHTNADAAWPGVSDALAELLGINVERPLVPHRAAAHLLITYVPPSHVETVVDAMAAAGAGKVGDYDRCAFTSPGVGTFEVPLGAQPFLGSPGNREAAQEVRIEMVVPAGGEPSVLAALRQAHPYEEVAYSLLATTAVSSQLGLGRVGTLGQAQSLADFADRVALSVPRTATGIRIAGDLDTQVRTVAVCGGSGGEFLPMTAGCDVYITSDLRHHVVQDHLAAGGCPVIEVTHWAAERPWCDQAAGLLTTELASSGYAEPTVIVSPINTDPWTRGSLVEG